MDDFDSSKLVLDIDVDEEELIPVKVTNKVLSLKSTRTYQEKDSTELLESINQDLDTLERSGRRGREEDRSSERRRSPADLRGGAEFLAPSF